MGRALVEGAERQKWFWFDVEIWPADTLYVMWTCECDGSEDAFQHAMIFCSA